LFNGRVFSGAPENTESQFQVIGARRAGSAGAVPAGADGSRQVRAQGGVARARLPGHGAVSASVGGMRAARQAG